MFYSVNINNTKFSYDSMHLLNKNSLSTIYKASYDNLEHKQQTLALKVTKDVSKVLMQVKQQILSYERITQNAILKDYFIKTFGHKITPGKDVDNKTIITFYLVMEYYEQGNLQQFLENKGKLSEDTALQLITQLIHALDELQKLGIFIRNLKLSNLFVKEDKSNISLKIDLFDFHNLLNEVKQQNFCIIKEEIWHIGRLYYLMLYGLLTYESQNLNSMQSFSTKKQLTFPPSINNTSKLSQDFISKCIELDNEFSWQELYNDRLFKSKLKELEFQKNARRQPKSTTKIFSKYDKDSKKDSEEGSEESKKDSEESKKDSEEKKNSKKKDLESEENLKLCIEHEVIRSENHDGNSLEQKENILHYEERKRTQILKRKKDQLIDQKETILSYEHVQSQFQKTYDLVKEIQSFRYEIQGQTSEFVDNISSLQILSYALIKKLDSLLAKSEQFYQNISSKYLSQDLLESVKPFTFYQSLQLMRKRTTEDLQEFQEKIKANISTECQNILMVCIEARHVLEQTLKDVETMHIINLIFLIEEVIEENRF